MAVQEEFHKTYQIPENFVDDSRIIKGMFRTKNFIEAVLLVLFSLVPAMLIPLDTIMQRITTIILICGPFFVLGVVGINGDTFFSFVKQMRSWRAKRCLMLYNSSPQAIYKTPLDALMESETAKDKIVDLYDRIRNSQGNQDKKIMIEGVDFEFKEDPMLKKLYIRNEENEEDSSDDSIIENIYDLAQKLDHEQLIEMINETSEREGDLDDSEVPLFMFDEIDFGDL